MLSPTDILKHLTSENWIELENQFGSSKDHLEISIGSELAGEKLYKTAHYMASANTAGLHDSETMRLYNEVMEINYKRI